MRYKEIFKVYNKVFDLQTFRNLKYLLSNGFLKNDNLSLVSEGKEAIVFRGESYDGPVAVKIYKVMSISYKDQYKYLLMDPRFQGVRRTRIEIIYTWVKKEYSNLQRLYKKRVSVPMPIISRGNILVMEFIGEENPAPAIKDIKLNDLDAKKLLNRILKEYWKMYNKAELVHGDFSEFNILYLYGKPVIIDVSQAIPVYAPSAREFLERDSTNLERISKRLKSKISKEEIISIITSPQIEKGKAEGPSS